VGLRLRCPPTRALALGTLRRGWVGAHAVESPASEAPAAEGASGTAATAAGVASPAPSPAPCPLSGAPLSDCDVGVSEDDLSWASLAGVGVCPPSSPLVVSAPGASESVSPAVAPAASVGPYRSPDSTATSGPV